MTTISFIHPGSISRISGGTIYDKKMFEKLKELIEITLVEVPGDFPYVSSLELVEFKQMKDSLQPILLVDGLACKILFENQDLFRKHDIFYLFHNPLQLGGEFTDKQRKELQVMELTVLRKVKGIVATSNYSRDYIHRYVQEIPIEVIIPGRPEIPNYSEPNHQRGSEFSIVNVGSLTPRKNVILLLKAIKLIKERLRVDIVGVQSDREYLVRVEKMIASIPQHDIFLHGEVNNISPFYASSDLLVHVPINESYGMVIPEAMGYGLPVIATKTDGIQDTMQDAGLLVPLNNHKALAQQIQRIMQETEFRQILAERSLDAYQQLNSWENQAKNLYRFLLN